MYPYIHEDLSAKTTHQSSSAVEFLKKSSGFSLLEVIMAMVVLSTSLLPLFAIFGNYLSAMRNMSDQNEKVQAREQILSYMNGVNPFDQKEGNFELGSLSFSWNATPLVENIENVDSNSGRVNKGNFKVSLYDTQINATKPNNDKWLEFSIRQIGYEKKQNAPLDAGPMPDEDELDSEGKEKKKPAPLRPSIPKDKG
ncbi:MAG: prepilin-type N-terminal cleavage/methylation domain-containing protein [Alphaproteobacteria bacterium]|nr:prepilin-type N-terminal cleavage/methylation domain-containing protein [Alphaproteobacteria bacterium]